MRVMLLKRLPSSREEGLALVFSRACYMLYMLVVTLSEKWQAAKCSRPTLASKAGSIS